MTNRNWLPVSVFFLLLLGCGPACPDIKVALDVSAALADDAARLNEMVSRRKAAAGEAEQGGKGTFHIERVRFSVTAWELAIETQARIIKASPRFEDAESYGEGAETINRFRCYLDRLLAREGHLINDGTGKTLRAHKVEIDDLLDRDGAVTPSELRGYLENGIEVDAAVDRDDDDEEEEDEGEDKGEEPDGLDDLDF